MSETFAKKEDITAILNELKQMREESRTSGAYLDDELRRFHHTVQGLGARWGLMSGEAFRSGLAAILTGELGFRVERYEGYDDSGSVFGQPEQVEMDVIIRNGLVIRLKLNHRSAAATCPYFKGRLHSLNRPKM